MDKKLTALTEVTTLGDDTLIYAVDPDRTVGDRSVGIDKDVLFGLIGALLKGNNLSDLLDASAARTNLGVAIGTDVQAFSSVLAATTASYTTAEESKLSGIEAGATADQTASDVPNVPSGNLSATDVQAALNELQTALDTKNPLISHLEFNDTNKTVWNNGKGNIDGNTSFGEDALESNTTGGFNTANGTSALRLNTEGNNNTSFGSYALLSNTTGSNNTSIGSYSNVSTGNLTNATAIGFNSIVNASNKIQLGNASVTDVATSGKITAAPATLSTHLATKGQLDDGLALKANIADIVNNVTAGGVAVPLSAEQGKILKAEILALAGSLIPQGNWNANTNTPDISATTETGYYWIVSVDGATDIGGITDWKVTDWAIKTATGWAKIDNTDKVLSVNGRIGEIELDSSDVGLANADNTSDANKPISSATQTALNDKANIASPTFTGNATFGSNVTATNFIGNALLGLTSKYVAGSDSANYYFANTFQGTGSIFFGADNETAVYRFRGGSTNFNHEITATNFIGSGDGLTDVVKLTGTQTVGGVKTFSNDATFEGSVKADAFKLSALNTAPASASSTGVTGDIRYTADYIYVCVATDTWKRSEITTW